MATEMGQYYTALTGDLGGKLSNYIYIYNGRVVAIYRQYTSRFRSLVWPGVL